jgi:Zn-dependent protease with chaperone function
VEALSRRGIASRALAIACLWVGFWLLTLGLCAALAWIPITQGRYAGGLGVGGWAAGLLAATLAWAARPRGWFQKREPLPTPLSPDTYGALYAFVEQIARRMGQPAPRALVLTGAANAYATVERRWLGLRRERRVGVGLPLIACLTRDELAAVICHELGHHLGGDLALGSWVYRTRRALADAVSDLDDSSFFLDLPFRAYGRLFLRASAALSREQERAADACASAAWGARAMAAALEKTEVLGPLWAAYLEHDVAPAVSEGVRVPLLEGFHRFVAGERRSPAVAEGLTRREETVPSPWDTHPSLEERLAALGRKRTRPPLRAQEHCLELLGGAAAAEDALYQLWSDAPLRAISWERLGEDLLLPGHRQVLARVGLEPGGAGLEALLPLIAQGERLFDRVRGASLDLLSPEAKRRRARGLLGRWLTVALADRGFSPEVAPGAAVRMVRGEVAVEPRDWVDRLATGALSQADYLAWARALSGDAVLPTGQRSGGVGGRP